MPRRLFAALVLLGSAIGCGGGSTAMGPFSVVPGPQPTAYAGSIQDSASGAGTLRLTATLAAFQISGTYASFAVTPTCPAARTGTFAATRQ